MIASELRLRTPARRPVGDSPLSRILDTARWAPSGDNGQPWRFEPTGAFSLNVHVSDEAEHDVYDFGGRGTLLSAGMLLETMRIAASERGRAIRWSYRLVRSHEHLLEVEFRESELLSADSLASYVRIRSVDRRPYRTKSLTASQEKSLALCLGGELSLHWFRSLPERLRCARLNNRTSDFRLRLPEAQAVHERMVDFRNTHSEGGVASRSLGLDPATHAFMRWAMNDRKRLDRVTRLLGTGLPSFEMDVLPGLLCAAHFLVTFNSPLSPVDEPVRLLQAGERLQRFWLRATELGLVMQPSVAPLSFAYHAENEAAFTADVGMRHKAAEIATMLRSLVPGHDMRTIMFGGRVGTPRMAPPRSRSLRRPLSQLMVPGASPFFEDGGRVRA